MVPFNINFTDRRPFEQEKGPLKAFVRIDLRRPEIIMNQKHNGFI